MSQTMHHFLLAEDEVILRQLLKAHLKEEFPGCEIAEGASLAELKEWEKAKGKVDLAIIDLELSDGNSLDWIEQWLKTSSQNRAIVLSALDEDYILFRALRSNLPGFVHKKDPIEILHLAIRTVLSGGVFFSPTVQKFRTRMQADPDFFNKVLSEREQGVLRLLGQGLSNAEAGQLLGLRESSVADHRKNIMQKLNLANQAELVRYAVKKGFSGI